MRRTAAWSFALVAALAAGCAPGDDTPRANCETELLGVGHPYHCRVQVKALKRLSRQVLDTESGNFEAVVSARFTVERGRVLVAVHGAKGEAASTTVTPGTPGSLEVTLPLNRPLGGKKAFFALAFTPLDGTADGVAGTVDFHDVR